MKIIIDTDKVKSAAAVGLRVTGKGLGHVGNAARYLGNKASEVSESIATPNDESKPNFFSRFTKKN